MDFESASAFRDAFLFEVHRQFEGLARWVALPATANVWEDGREAVFSVTRDGEELICFAVTLGAEGGDERGPDLRATVAVERQQKLTGTLVLGWTKSLPAAETRPR